jgi:hypothetical protein
VKACYGIEKGGESFAVSSCAMTECHHEPSYSTVLAR